MQIDRRRLISGLALSACAAGLPKTLYARTNAMFFDRSGPPIGIQLYSLGPEAGKDLDATFAQIAEIGYREIELPGLYGKTPAAIRQAAQRAGLSVSSVHLPLVPSGGSGLSLGSDPQRIAEDLGAIGARWAIAPLLMLPQGFRPQPGETMENAISRSVVEGGADVWKKTAAALNEKAAALKATGIQVAYHNHNLEFAPIGDTNGWEILWRETQPGLVHFEVDVGWVAAAGLDPVRFLNSAAGRVRLIHLKDVAADNVPGYRITMKPANLGTGKLDFPGILAAARKVGCQHFLFEQEPPFAIPRIEAARIAFAFLKGVRA
ncbi:sugar phosphate isomerase/epimerase [Novosphingobium sp. BL-8H]|uniref:sugar phosphate isomerase/epimerase family protein n=1 Tax=Novosphingobium sp. BL-8H TaxID=3127640 RepID=UPI00375790F3